MPATDGEDSNRVKVQLESTLDSVDAAEQLVLQTARRMGFDEDDQHSIGIAVRESMVNAVAHGNRYNLHKKVHLDVESFLDRLEVRIGDEGNGFDPGAVPDPVAAENLLRQSGRGLLMIQAFMDEFLVRRRDPQGTEITLVKRLPAS